MSDYENNNTGTEREESEKYESRSIRVQSPMGERFDNFWFHHKGKVITALLAVVLLIVLLVQCVSNTPSDVTAVYCGRVYLSGSEVESVQQILSGAIRAASEESDATLGLVQYHVYSKEQIESLRAETHEDGEPYYINSSLSSDNYEGFYEYIKVGESAILLLEPWLYEELLKQEGYLKPMSFLFSSVPPSVDEKGYGIILGETEIYQYYEALQVIPADTVMCFMSPLIWGDSSNDKLYAGMQDAFRAIVTFTPPN